jgi:hypothetical protein
LPTAPAFVIESDATIVAPLIFARVLGWGTVPDDTAQPAAVTQKQVLPLLRPETAPVDSNEWLTQTISPRPG